VDAQIDADIVEAGTADAALADAAPDQQVDAAPPVVEHTACTHQGAVFEEMDRDNALQWSDAHALSRFFGPHTNLGLVDEALASALAAADPVEAYADALDFACAVATMAPTALPASDVTVNAQGVAYIRPGVGSLTPPNEATAIVLDLRDLPDAPGLEDALRAASAVALSEPLPRTFRMRQLRGLPDQIFSQAISYSNRIVTHELDPWPGEGLDVPLVVYVDDAPAPLVAELAGGIRTARRGWLVGAPIFSAVAESERLAIGTRALSIRVAAALTDGVLWPKVIEADAESPEALENWAAVPPAVSVLGVLTRTPFERLQPYNQFPRTRPSAAAERSMLIVAHGALRRFFPYFDVVGDNIDERLLEGLALAAQPGERARTRQLLARFSHAFSDGHAFIYDYVDPFEGYAPFWVDHLSDGRPVVRRSAAEGVRPGQVLITINDRPAADWYADELARTSAASRGYALDLASRRYLEGNGPLAITVEDLDGTRHARQIDRVPFLQTPPITPWLHSTGFLERAPGVFYLNMGGDVESDEPDLIERLDAALPQAEALIVDMRGYPGVNHYSVAIRLVGARDFRSPIFETPVWTGPNHYEETRIQYGGGSFGVDAPGFAGPIVLLVGPISVSAAENFSSMLVPLDNVTVMGRRSAGTNGTITGMNLPGGMGLTMTGMRVLDVDGNRFHGVGIVPDVEIWPTTESLWNQDDIVLNAAIEHLVED
jgi:hypothetical protein